MGGEGEQPLFPVWHSVASFSSPGSRHLEDLERNHPLLSSCDSLPLTAQPGQQAGDPGQGSSLTPPGPWTPGAHRSLEKTKSSACQPAPSPSSSVLLFSVSHHIVSHWLPRPQERELKQPISASLPPCRSCECFYSCSWGRGEGSCCSWRSPLLQLLSDYSRSDCFFIPAFTPLTTAYSRIPRPIPCHAEQTGSERQESPQPATPMGGILRGFKIILYERGCREQEGRRGREVHLCPLRSQAPQCILPEACRAGGGSGLGLLMWGVLGEAARACVPGPPALTLGSQS